MYFEMANGIKHKVKEIKEEEIKIDKEDFPVESSSNVISFDFSRKE